TYIYTQTTQINTLSLHDALPIYGDYEDRFRKPFYAKYATNEQRLNYAAYLRDSTNADYYGPSRWNEEYYQTSPSYNVDMSLTGRSEEHTSELQSRENIVCRLLLE